MKQKILISVCILAFLFISIFLCNFAVNKSDKAVVIKFSSWGSQSEVEIIKSVISDFEEKNPDIKIDFIHIPQNYFQKIHLLFASGLEPDVLFINNRQIQLYINANLLTDLTPYFNKADDIFFSEALDCFKGNGKIYAIPRDISNLVLYYNKDILKETGVKLPKKINTIEELQEIAKQLTNEKHWGVNFEEDPLWWMYYLAANGGGAISDDLSSVIINSPNSIEALNLYADMINKEHIIPNKAQVGSMTSAQMFINGKIAMYLSGRWMVPKFRETVTFDWDITEFPSSDENKVYIDASGWAVSENSKHKAEAVEFVKYLSSAQAIDKFTESGLIVPSRKDTAKSDVFLEKNKKPYNNIAFIEMLKNAKPTPVNKNYGSVNDILKEKSQCVFEGKCRAEDAFNSAVVKELESLL